ncbi:MAG: DHH family phosphoesterase [Candidatus Helarchaeota archaeon]|nr:DHH family phosphoesterase [Candidatus Helarchaeota archaeon]
MNPLELNKEFRKALEVAAEKIKSWIKLEELIRISSHIDADGIAAAGIICSALSRLGARYHLRIFRQLETEFIKSLAQEKQKSFIFSDFGSGQIEILSKVLPTEDIIILDHHQPLSPSPKHSNILEINPHLFGVDGSTEISGAGVCFLIAQTLDPQTNLNLLPLALVGALGDTQDKAKQHTLLGLNAKIAELGMKENLIQIEKDLYFPYSEMKPIQRVLMETTDPFLPDLTGNEEACVRFLGSIGIPLYVGDNWRTISDLSTEEKKNLTTQLTQLILSHDGTSEQASSLVSTHYKFLTETELYLKDGRTYAALINACGRTRNPGIGVAVCMGDRDVPYRRAQDLLIKYQETLNQFLENLKHPGTIRETDYLQYFYGGQLDETMVGRIATIALQTKIAKPTKPLIGFATSNDKNYKISARAQDALVKKGLHLAKALRKTISQLGLDTSEFLAGGHDAAAGTRIPISHDSLFIETLNKIIKEKITK